MNQMPAVVGTLEKTRAADRYLSLITVGELFFGISRSQQVERNLSRYRRAHPAKVIRALVPQGFEAHRALRSDTLEKPLARNGIQEVDGSIPFSSTSKIKYLPISSLRLPRHCAQFCALPTARTFHGRDHRHASFGLGCRKEGDLSS